jgi:hypothetical protein
VVVAGPAVVANSARVADVPRMVSHRGEDTAFVRSSFDLVNLNWTWYRAEIGSVVGLGRVAGTGRIVVGYVQQHVVAERMARWGVD